MNTRTGKIARLQDGRTAALSCPPVANLSADNWAGLKAESSRQPVAPWRSRGGSQTQADPSRRSQTQAEAQAEGGPVAPVASTKTPENPIKSK